MPASKRSHVLSILRKNLALKQTDLADMVGCSVQAIQSVEVGRLKLSESLAARIVAVTGCDMKWLLKNDVSEPMPPRPFFIKGVESVGLQTYVMTITLLIDVFSRLFAETRKLDKTGARDELELCLAKELETLKKTVKEPGTVPLHSTTKEAFQYFDEYPGSLPDELYQMLDLDYLIMTAPERDQLQGDDEKKIPHQRAEKAAPRRRKAPSRSRRSI